MMKASRKLYRNQAQTLSMVLSFSLMALLAACGGGGDEPGRAEETVDEYCAERAEAECGKIGRLRDQPIQKKPVKRIGRRNASGKFLGCQMPPSPGRSNPVTSRRASRASTRISGRP